MKKITLSLLGLLFAGTIGYAQHKVETVKRDCAAHDILEEKMASNPALRERMHKMEEETKHKMLEMASTQRRIEGNVYQIPVVVHILYTNSTNNISDAQIQSQLDVLNADFRRTNADRTNRWPQAADSEIEFYLAEVDPNGNATTGITRTRVNTSTWTQREIMKRSATGGVDAWDTTEYLNMWVVDNMSFGGRTILGYAQFPWDNDRVHDGVVMADQYFGNTGTAQAPFDGGRTTTHEVGHYLGLRHIWGDSSDCAVDDGIDDTPRTNQATSGCGVGKETCNSPDMTENYMDYSNDNCLNLFTTGQRNKMRTYLQAGGSRRALALSDKTGNGGGGNPPAADPCNGGVTLTTNTGSFADGSGNSNYADNRNCTWLIRPENGGRVTLNFTSFNTENNYDFVTVYDGANDSATQLGRFSGTSRPAAVTSTGNAMYVKFTSDGSVNAAGWAASYTSATNTADTQAPSRPTNVSASSITQTTATLNWTASTDNVGVTGYDIYNGTSNLGSRTSTSVNLTGLTANTSYTFSVRAKDAAGNESAAGSVTFRTATTTPPVSDACNGGATLTTNTGSFVDGSGSSNYADNRDCTWLIRPANGGTVTLNFSSFNTESGYDFVTVYDGASASATQLGRFSGTSTPSAVTSTGNALFVRFTSDGSVNRAGWAASYTSNVVSSSDPCDGGATLTANSGSFADGSGSSSYGNNRDCTWLIRPSNGGRVTLNFSSFNTESGYDFVTVYDGATTSARQLGRFSGTSRPNAVTSTGGTMLVRFTSDGSVNRAGWAASYTSSSSTREDLSGTNSLLEVAVYPNPVEGNTLFVKALGINKATFRVINTLGQTVQNGDLKSEVNVATLKAGIYLLEVNDGIETITKKFIKK